MQIFTDTRFDFMGKRFLGIAVSTALLAVTLFAVFHYGFNLGIDFRGGTEIEFKFAEKPDIAVLRSRLDGLEIGDISLQRVGTEDENTILVRARADEGAAVSRRIVRALYTPEEIAALKAGRFNLNQVGEEDLVGFLGRCRVNVDDPPQIARSILRFRTGVGGVVLTYESLDAVPGVTPDVRACLEEGSFLSPFAKWKDYFVGPKVGEELRNKAMWAIGVALVLILIYISFRFQLEYGIGAVVALFHDVIITTGVLVLLGEEFTLTVVAALLTLAGYSVNDTIVVFDRIRENLRVKRTLALVDVINLSINQTLGRTVLTSASTLLVVFTMLMFGGPEFRGFSVALLIGVVLGTYSSVFVASLIVSFWHGFMVRARAGRAARA